MKAELSERTGQLKALVKDNFDRFISCKNTIDDIHARLLKAEKTRGGDAQGVSSSDMVLAVGEVQGSIPSHCVLWNKSVFPPFFWGGDLVTSRLHLVTMKNLGVRETRVVAL